MDNGVILLQKSKVRIMLYMWKSYIEDLKENIEKFMMDTYTDLFGELDLEKEGDDEINGFGEIIWGQ